MQGSHITYHFKNGQKRITFFLLLPLLPIQEQGLLLPLLLLCLRLLDNFHELFVCLVKLSEPFLYEDLVDSYIIKQFSFCFLEIRIVCLSQIDLPSP